MRENWSSRELLLGGALFAVLITLAVLQYRWIGQVGEAERARMDRALRTAVNRFVEDFDGALQDVARVAIAGAVFGADAEPQFELWRETARYPDIITRASVVAESALPDGLRNLPIGGRGGAVASPLMASTDSSLFAVPLGGPEARGPEAGGPESGGAERWLLIELDLAYIRESLLPDLAARHFGDQYHVEITGPSGVIFRSDDEPHAEFEESGRGGVFAFPSGAFGRGRGKGPPPEFKEPPKEPRKEPPGERGPKGRGARGRGPGEPRWQVLAAHKSGTLDERVAGIRTRNLAVSFGMLLLMGASVGMLLMSSRRARVLARQQMEFVAGVTHELRTPLAVISSASQNLADGVTAGEEKTRRYGAVINQQSKRLAEMVEQVLRFAGLASERIEAARQPVDVSLTIEQAVADCQPDLAASGCELTRDVAADLPVVNGDPVSLVHCLRNLLGNAIKHGAGAPVRLTAAAANGGVEIRVEDSGPGIDPADLPHIFEPFYRGRRATADQIQGTGLGLSLVKKIVANHGGKIEAISRPGEGARFVLWLPAGEDQ